MDISSKFRLGAIALAISTLMASPSFAQGEGGPTPSFTPQSGWWTNPNQPGGRSVLIETNAEGGIFASMLAFDDTQRSVWYVIDTRNVNGGQVGELQQFVGGQSLNGPYKQGTFLGFFETASFFFTSPTTGTVNLAGQAMEIQRHDIVANGVAMGPQAGAPRSGWWWSPQENGRGYFLEAQGDNMLFAGLMYDDLGQATWYSASGTMITPTVFSAQLIQPHGGQTLNGPYTTQSQGFDEGSMTIQFTSDTTATLTIPSGRQIPLLRYTF